jgi:hypothetical protein
VKETEESGKKTGIWTVIVIAAMIVRGERLGGRLLNGILVSDAAIPLHGKHYA